MKTKLKTTLALLAAFCGLQLFTATPALAEVPTPTVSLGFDNGKLASTILGGSVPSNLQDWDSSGVTYTKVRGSDSNYAMTISSSSPVARPAAQVPSGMSDSASWSVHGVLKLAAVNNGVMFGLCGTSWQAGRYGIGVERKSANTLQVVYWYKKTKSSTAASSYERTIIIDNIPVSDSEAYYHSYLLTFNKDAAGTAESPFYTLYFDGVKVGDSGTTAKCTGCFNNEKMWCVGTYYGGADQAGANIFSGAQIDDFAVWATTCLSAEQAVELAAKFPSKPIQNAYLWLDASDASTIMRNASGQVTNWVTRSVSGRSAISYTTSPVTAGPSVTPGALDGKDVVNFGSVGSNQDLKFDATSNIRAVFMVTAIDDSSNAFILGGEGSNFNFHRGTESSNVSYFSGNASSNLRDGVIRRNCEAKTSSTAIGTGYGLITLIPTAGVNASRICQDRDQSGRNGGKKVAELIILTDAITDSQRDEIEQYLMDKWLPTAKTYTATFSENKKFSELTWDQEKPAGGFRSVDILKINNTAAAKLTIDQDIKVGTFKIENTSGNALTLGFDGHSINAAFDKASAAGGVTIDVSGDWGAEIAKYAVAGAPYSYWYISGSGDLPNDPSTMPTLPTGYSAISQKYTGYGMRLVVTAPNTAKFGAVSVNVRSGTDTLGSSSNIGVYPMLGSEWGYQSGASAVTQDSVTFTPYKEDGSTFETENGNTSISDTTSTLYLFRAFDKDYSGSSAHGDTTTGYTLSGLNTKFPNGKYRVIVYLATDGASKNFAPVKINDVAYAGPASGSTTLGYTLKNSTATSWGHSGNSKTSNAATEGVNYIVSDVLEGDIVSIRTKGTNAYKGTSPCMRAAIAAIQVVKVGVQTYTATVTGDGNWSELGWFPSKPAGGFPAGSNFVLTNNGSADVTTVTIDAPVNANSVKVVSETKVLKFGHISNLTTTAYDFSEAPGGVGIGVTGGWVVTDPLKTYIRNNAVKVIFYSTESNGATLDYGTGNTTSLSGHYVFDGGTHAFTWGMNAGSGIFSTTGTLDNPVLLTKSGTTLNFTMRDLCGWNDDFVEGSTIRVADGATMNLLASGTLSMYMRGRLVLDPGSTTTYKTGSGAFKIYGGSDQAATAVTKAQIYVPAPTGENKVATFSKNAQSSNNLDFSKSAAAISVEGEATLNFDTPFSGNQELKKYGAGTWNILGSISSYSSKISTMGGKTIIACGGTVQANQWVSSGTVLEIGGASDTTLSGTITGAGEVRKTGTGKATLSGSASTYTGTFVVNEGIFDIRGLRTGTGIATIAEGAKLSVKQAATGEDDTITITGTSLAAGDYKTRVQVCEMHDDATLMPIKSATVADGTLTIKLDKTIFNVEVSSDTTLSAIESKETGGGAFEQSAQLTIQASNDPVITVDKSLHITQFAIEGQTTLKYTGAYTITAPTISTTATLKFDCTGLTTDTVLLSATTITGGEYIDKTTGIPEGAVLLVSANEVRLVFKARYQKFNYGTVYTWTTTGSGNVDFATANSKFQVFDLEGCTNKTDVTYTGTTKVGGQDFWHQFAYSTSVTGYTAPGEILRLEQGAYCTSIGATYGPMTFGGILAEPGDTDYKIEYTSGKRSSLLGDPTAETPTFFDIGANVTFNRSGKLYLAGTMTFDIADGKTFDLNSNQGTYDLAIFNTVTAGGGGDFGTTTAGGTIIMKGAGTLKVATLKAEGSTLDYSNVSLERDTAYITGAIQINDSTKFNLPAGLAENTPFKLASSITGAPTGATIRNLSIGGVEAQRVVTFDAANGTIKYLDINAYEATINAAGTHQLSTLGWGKTFAPTIYDSATITIDSGVTGEVVINMDNADLTINSITIVSAGSATVRFTGSTPAAINAWNFSEAAGLLDLGISPGAASVTVGTDTILNTVGTGNITINSGKMLTVKGSGLTASKVTNNGTLKFDGGSAETPLAYTADGAAGLDLGTMTLAAGAYVKVTANENKCYHVTGQGANSFLELTREGDHGFGTTAGTQFRSLTLVSAATSGQKLWIQVADSFDNTVNVVVKSGEFYLDGYSPTIGTLSGTGGVTRSGSATLTITPTVDATYSGASTVPFTIGGTAVQTLSGAYTGALTVNGAAAFQASAATMTLAGNITVADGKTLTVKGVDGGTAVKFTGTISGTGTIALDANVTSVDFGQNRPTNVTFGSDDTTVQFTEVVAEDGVLNVSSAFTGRTITVMGLDGTIHPLAGGRYTPTVCGAACLYDYTFTNKTATTSSKVIKAASTSQVTNKDLEGDVNAVYTNYNATTEWYTALRTTVRPHNKGGFTLTTPFSVAVAGCFPSHANTVLASFGSSKKCLFLSSGDKENEVKLVSINASSTAQYYNFWATDCTVLTTMSVPDAATAQHTVVFETADMQTINIYLDGVKWSTYEFDSPRTIQTGFQVGGWYGGNAEETDKCYRQALDTATDKTATNSYVSAVRIFNVTLGPNAVKAFADEFTYDPPSGSYARTIDTATADWDSADAWTFSKGGTVNVPAAGGVVKLTASAETTVAVNLAENVSYNSLELNGPMTIATNATSGAHGGKISSAGKVQIFGATTLDYGAIDISGSPLTVGSSGSVCFDMAAFDASRIFKTDYIQLTGTVDQNDAKFSAKNLPPNTAERTFEFGYRSSDHTYGVTVTVTPHPFVYTIAEGGEGVWTWGTQGVTEEIVRAQPTGDFEKAGTGVAEFAPFTNFTHTVKGGTLKFSTEPIRGMNVTVDSGATFDLNGKKAREMNLTLAGGKVTNSSSEALSEGDQIKTITLTADSTIEVPNAYQVYAQSFNTATTIALGTFTLTKTGSAQLKLVNTDITGTGTFLVNEGTVFNGEDSRFAADVTLSIGASGTWEQRDGNRNTFVSKVTGAEGGTLNVAGKITGFELTGTLNLTGNGSYGTITNQTGAVANIGTRHNYYTFSGAGGVKAKFSTDPQPGDVVTIFKVADSATTGIAELKKSDDSVIPASYYTVANGVVTFKKEAKIGTTYYFVLAAALDAAGADATVTLCTNVTDFAYTLAKNITFDGDIYEITGDGFTGSGKLTIAGGYIGVTSLPESRSLIGGKYKNDTTWAAETNYHYANLASLSELYESYKHQIVAGSSGQTDEKVYPAAVVDGSTTNYVGDLAFTKAELKDKGIIESTETSDADVAKALNAKGKNTRPTWENVVLGLSNTATDAQPVPVPVQGTSTTRVSLKLGSNVSVDTKSGAKVTYKVKTRTGSEWTTLPDEYGYGDTATVDLPGEGVKYYKFDVIVTPAK